MFKQFHSVSQPLKWVSVEPILFSWTGGFRCLRWFSVLTKNTKKTLVLLVFNIVICETNFESISGEIYLPIIEIFLGHYKKDH